MCLAIPGKIVSLSDKPAPWREGRVDFSGVIKPINLVCVPEAGLGDYVLVHAGLAISVVDPEEAQAVLEQFRRMGEDDEAREGP